MLEVKERVFTKIPENWNPEEFTVSELSDKDYDIYRNLGGRDRMRFLISARDNHTCQNCGKKWKYGNRKFPSHKIGLDDNRTYKQSKEEQADFVTFDHKCHSNIYEHVQSMMGNRNKPRKVHELTELEFGLEPSYDDFGWN